MNWTLVSTLTLTSGEAELPEFLAELERARWTAKLRIAAATSPAAERRAPLLTAEQVAGRLQVSEAQVPGKLIHGRRAQRGGACALQREVRRTHCLWHDGQPSKGMGFASHAGVSVPAAACRRRTLSVAMASAQPGGFAPKSRNRGIGFGCRTIRPTTSGQLAFE